MACAVHVLRQAQHQRADLALFRLLGDAQGSPLAVPLVHGPGLAGQHAEQVRDREPDPLIAVIDRHDAHFNLLPFSLPPRGKVAA